LLRLYFLVVSLHIAPPPPSSTPFPYTTLFRSDTAMYQAKAAGRRTYMRYTEAMDVSIRRRATVSGALRKVLDRGELRLVYQPRLDRKSTRLNSSHVKISYAVFCLKKKNKATKD